MLLRANDKCA